MSDVGNSYCCVIICLEEGKLHESSQDRPCVYNSRCHCVITLKLSCVWGSLGSDVYVMRAYCKAMRSRSLGIIGADSQALRGPGPPTIRGKTTHCPSKPRAALETLLLRVCPAFSAVTIQPGAFLLDFVLCHLIDQSPPLCALCALAAGGRVSSGHGSINHGSSAGRAAPSPFP